MNIFALTETMNTDTWFTIKYLIVTIVFLLLLYLLSRLLVKKTRFKQSRGKSLKLVEIVFVSQDSYVYVLEFENTKYVVASNKNSIQLLDKIEIEFEQILADKVVDKELDSPQKEEE